MIHLMMLTLPYDRASYKMRVARAVLNFPHLLDSNTCEFLLRYQSDQMHVIQVGHRVHDHDPAVC